MKTHKEPRKSGAPLNYPITERFSFSASNVDLNFLYSITMSRILKDYSTKEVSFLIGSDRDMIGDFERGKVPELMMNLLLDTIKALDRSIYDFMCSSVGAGDDDSTYELIRSKYPRYIEQTVIRTNGPNKGETVYKLFEETAKGMMYTASEDEAMDRCRVKVVSLLEEDAFDQPISAIDVFRICTDLPGTIRPRHVQNAIYELVAKQEFPKLKVIKVRRGSRYYHQKIAFQKINE